MKKHLRIRCLWILVNVLRLLLAVAFIFSGTVKLIDPHGTEFKIQDYGHVFGLSGLLQFGLPLMLSVLLAVVEFSLGIFTLFGIRRRLTTHLMMLFMLVMVPLTLYLALYNPISDCGCFGDALKLTNWQSFAKNIFILIAAFVCRYYYRLIPRFITERNQWTVSLYSWVFALVFASINIYRLPLIDFRPYHIGANLLQELEPTDTDGVQFETTFILEKDGVQREFTLEDYPDSTWTFVTSKTVQYGVVGAGHGEMQDFRITHPETGDDVTLDILRHKGYTFLLIAPYLEQSDDGVMDKLAFLYDYSLENGYPFYCLTSSTEAAQERWRDVTGAEYPIYYADAIVLKTMIRANPGLMLLHDGVVLNKWSSHLLPSDEELVSRLEESKLAHPPYKSYMMRVVRILLWYILPLLLFTLADRVWVMWKLRKLHKY